MNNKLRDFVKKLGLLLVMEVALTTAVNAATITYNLDNIMQDNGAQLTGSFDWTYTPGDFENGSGVFTNLNIPGYGSDISALTIVVDIAEIDFSLTANIDSGGVNVNLILLNAFTATSAASLDLSRSAYEIERGVLRGGFLAGTITPEPVPLPATAWLMISGITGLFGFYRRQPKLI